MQDQYHNAEAYLLKALAINLKLDRQEGTACQYGNLGTLYHAKDQLDQAATYWLKALSINKKQGRKEATAFQFTNLGHICQAQGHISQARDYWQQALGVFRQINQPDYIKQAQQVQSALDAVGTNQ